MASKIIAVMKPILNPFVQAFNANLMMPKPSQRMKAISSNTGCEIIMHNAIKKRTNSSIFTPLSKYEYVAIIPYYYAYVNSVRGNLYL